MERNTKNPAWFASLLQRKAAVHRKSLINCVHQTDGFVQGDHVFLTMGGVRIGYGTVR